MIKSKEIDPLTMKGYISEENQPVALSRVVIEEKKQESKYVEE